MTKLAYAIGTLSDSIKSFSFTTFLLFYYTTVLGLPGTLLGLAMAIGLVWDAAVDPLIGHLSDRARTAFGRRHTFMLVGAICAGASFIAVFNPPSGLSTGALFAWLMVSSLCLRSSNSLFMVPYYALGAELARDYHERTSISGHRAAAAVAGTVLVTTAAFQVFLPGGAENEGSGSFAASNYASMGVAFGIAMIVTGLTATIGTLHERKRLAAAPATRSDMATFRRTVLDALRYPSFRIAVFSSAISFTAFAINAALAMHFLTYHARVAAGGGMTWYFAGFYAGALLGVPVWVRVSRRLEKHRVYAATTVATAFVMSSGYWLVGDGRPLGTEHVAGVAIASLLAGFFGTAAGVIVPSMMADITALDEIETGQRRDGIFFGIYSLGQQLAGGLAVLVAGVLVDRVAGLVPGQAAQSVVTVERLAVISNVLPAAILAAAGLLALRYPLTKDAVRSMHREVDAASSGQGVLA